MKEAMTKATLTVAKPVEKHSLLDSLSQLAADLRSQAKDLEAAADQLDEIALHAVSEVSSNDEELKRLKGLQQAMKAFIKD